MSEESVNSRRCKGGNLFFSRILFCICLCGPVAYALAEESTVVSEIRQNEKKSISGVVTDTNDEPLIGATVLVKGTQNGTVTDVDGRFHLKVNSGETLVVSYIGMKSKEVAVVDGKKELLFGWMRTLKCWMKCWLLDIRLCRKNVLRVRFLKFLLKS